MEIFIILNWRQEIYYHAVDGDFGFKKLETGENLGFRKCEHLDDRSHRRYKIFQMKHKIIFLIGLWICALLFVKTIDRCDTGLANQESSNEEFPCAPDQRFASTHWYNTYAASVRAVRKPGPCDECSDKFSSSWKFSGYACARWWHPTPHRHLYNYPLRNWSGVLRPHNQTVPQCHFGQLMVEETKCTGSQRQLFQALDKMRVIYFGRDGTELGIIRGSAYIVKDGDIDLFVDMPPEMLHEKLKETLNPPPDLTGEGREAGIQWTVGGCPPVNIAYFDWVGDELGLRAGPSDLCRCRLNSAELMCHARGRDRMYTLYGPSWEIKLGGMKVTDMPDWPIKNRQNSYDWGWSGRLSSRFQSLISKTTGRIEAETLNALAEKPLKEEKMAMILAHLNVFAASLADEAIICKNTLYGCIYKHYRCGILDRQ